jgi:hypothetical protein
MVRTEAQKVFNPRLFKIVVGHIGAGGHASHGEIRPNFRYNEYITVPAWPEPKRA